MKNILFLDDMAARHGQFVDMTYACTKDKDIVVRHVYNYLGAVEAFFEINTWDVMFLDHDLAEEDQMCTPGFTNRHKTGTDIAHYMIEHDIKSELIVLHSFNPSGRRRMSQILQEKYKIYEVPFGFPYPQAVIDTLLKG